MDKQTNAWSVWITDWRCDGVPYEFHAAVEILEWDSIDFVPPVEFERSYVDVLPGTWSDDGAQALCLLDSLLSCGWLEMEDLAERIVTILDARHIVTIGIKTAMSCFDI